MQKCEELFFQWYLMVLFLSFIKKRERIAAFSEIFVVLLQAYGFIISLSVRMFYIHARQCLYYAEKKILGYKFKEIYRADE